MGEKSKEFFRFDWVKVFVVFVFFFFSFLGVRGVPPFSDVEVVGDVLQVSPHPLLVLPLALIKDFSEIIQQLLAIPLLIIYYYLIACLLVFLYTKTKEYVK